MTRRTPVPNSSPHRLAAVLTLVIALTAAGGAAAAGADAAPPDGSTTWSVRPASADGADGRSWIEDTLDAGESTTDYMEIKNFGSDPVEFSLQAADGYFTDTGRFTMLPRGETSKDAGTWIALQDTVSVPAGGSVVVPFTITVPRDATPGDHPAGVAASVLSTGTDASGNNVAVDSRVGFRVMIRVSGELRPRLTITTSAEYRPVWSPFTPGGVAVGYTVRNTGNTRLSVSPTARVSGVLGSVVTAGAEITELAPGESRTGRVVLAGVWPGVVLDATVEATATAVPEASAPPVAETTHATTFAIPWPQFALALLLILAVLLLARAARRRRARIDRMLADAREEGRRSRDEPSA